MGAQWIHGQKGNPIYELSKQLHLIDENEGSARIILLKILINCFIVVRSIKIVNSEFFKN